LRRSISGCPMPYSSGNESDSPAASGGVRFVPLERCHLDEVLAIEKQSFACPWERRHFELLLEPDMRTVNHVALLAGRVLGYLCASRSGEEVKVNNFAVSAAHRRRGLGRWLLRRALDEAWRDGCLTALLEVRPSNTAALGLYAEFGFVELGRLEAYYRAEGEDAIVMRAKLREFGRY